MKPVTKRGKKRRKKPRVRLVVFFCPFLRNNIKKLATPWVGLSLVIIHPLGASLTQIQQFMMEGTGHDGEPFILALTHKRFDPYPSRGVKKRVSLTDIERKKERKYIEKLYILCVYIYIFKRGESLDGYSACI